MNLLVVLDVVAKIAWIMAKIGAGTASAFSSYQPKLPTQLISQK